MLQCPLVAEIQRNWYVDKLNQELVEQKALLLEAEFTNDVGVTRNKDYTKVVQVFYLILYSFLNQFE